MGTPHSIAVDLHNVIRAAEAFSSNVQFEPLFENIVRVQMKLTGASRCLFFRVHDGEWFVESSGEAAQACVSLIRMAVDHWHDAVKARITPVLSAGQRVLPNTHSRDEGQCWACLPIVREGETIAMVYLEWEDDGAPYDSQRVALVEALSGHIGIALEHASANAEVQRAILELRQAQARLEFDAYHDPLTGLRNRNWLIQHLDKLTVQFGQDRRVPQLAVLSLDLDRFKLLNDSLGHEIGDLLLRAVADVLSELLEPGMSAIRYGGDEFVVLLENNTEPDVVRAFAEDVTIRLNQPFALGSYVIYSNVRIGIAFTSPEHPLPEDILKDADMALIRAKERSGSNIQMFDPAMRQEVRDEAQLEHELRLAMTHPTHPFADMYLNYQPIISMMTGDLLGYEALVRWRHPEIGQILPVRFISLAEEIGLIEMLSWWTLKEACRQLGKWRRLPGGETLVIQVNISPILLMQVHFADRVAAVLHETGLPGNALKLEITESSTLDVEEIGLQALEHLRTLGVCLCIDDFGTGYSSLSRLRELPITTIKIDRVFISRMSSRNDGLAIVEMILALGEALRMDIVAEGVETNEQLQILRTIGCVLGQGFLFSVPLSANEAGRLVGKRLALEERHFAWQSMSTDVVS